MPASCIEVFTALRSARTSSSVGGSEVRNSSLTRSEPSGIDHDRWSRRSSEPRDLGAAAADVEGVAVAHRQVVHGAVEPQHRLVVAVDRLQRDPEAVSPVEQLLAVGGVANRRGRHRDHLGRARALGDRDEVAQRLERALDRLGPEPVAVAQLARQAQGRARVLDHVEVLALAEPEHDHAPRVRADVDDGEGAIVGRRVEGRVHVPMLPHPGRAHGRPSSLTRVHLGPRIAAQVPPA